MSRKAVRKKTKGATEHARFCPRFHPAVELIGRRWSGAILNAMLPGPQGFNELLSTVPGLSDRLLTERLRGTRSGGSGSTECASRTACPCELRDDGERERSRTWYPFAGQ